MKNDLKTISATPLVIPIEINGEKLDLVFRRVTVADRIYNSERFGGDEKLSALIEELNMMAIAKILFRQLTPESKNSLSVHSTAWADEDEEGNPINENLSKFEVFQRLPIFTTPEYILNLIIELSGAKDLAENSKKKANPKAKGNLTGRSQLQESPKTPGGQSPKSSP